MKEFGCQRSCLTCIWHEQCEDEKPCSFYDDGRDIMDLTDKEIQIKIENDRKIFAKQYEKYVAEDYDERENRNYSERVKNLS